jgi:hypothetical protein
VAEGDGLSPLEVRVAGHERAGLRLRKRERHERERVDRVACLGARVQHVHAERGRNLVVS